MKRFIAVLCAALLIGSAAGCGSASGGNNPPADNAAVSAATEQATAAPAESTAPPAETSAPAAESAAADTGAGRDPISIDVFQQYANFQGIQTGWFAKILKDKFNITANIISPNVSGGGDTLYQTRSASGNLGDLVFLDNANSKIQDSIQVGLFLDMNQNGLLDKYGAHLKEFSGAIQRYQKLYNTGDSVYGIPMQVSNQAPTEPQDGKFLNNGAFIRWDYYRELGKPQLKNFDDLLNMLKQMQAVHPTSESGKTVYPISLFKDWDGVLMNNPANINYMSGEEIIGNFAIIQYTNNYAVTDVLDRNAGYIQGLAFFNKANQMGIMDPDSPTQDFNTLKSKIMDGQALFCFWPWLGSSYNDINGNKQAGRGFAPVGIDNQKLIATGSTPNGQFRYVQVGSKTKYPERMVELLDWFYTPEYTELVNAGIEGLMWNMDNGEPVQTDFLDAAGNDTVMPDEYGGGTYSDGISQFGNLFITGTASDPLTGQAYIPDLWPSTLKNRLFQLDTDWQSDMGALTETDYMTNHNQIVVVPGTDYEDPTPTTDMQNTINQISTIIKDDSWKMVFAKDDTEFNALYDDMVTKVKAMGYDDVYTFYKNACDQKISMMKAALGQ